MEDKNSLKFETELLKLESSLKNSATSYMETWRRKLSILFYLKKYNQVTKEGYSYIGSYGPDFLVQKYIVAALCREEKYKESIEVLKRWEANYPNDQDLLENVRMYLGKLIQKVLEGEPSSQVFKNIEHDLELPHVDCGNNMNSSRLNTYGTPGNIIHASNTQGNTEVRFRNQSTWFPEPPPNTPYLNNLIRAYCDPSTLQEFRQNVDGVKLTWSSPVQVTTNTLEHSWIVLLRSQRRDTLRTVSLLSDTDRINFRISEAYFCDDCNYTLYIDLMTSNICNHRNRSNLQVLSTFIPPNCLNRPWYYYKLGFHFHANESGKYTQTIVFDFKEKPRLIQQLFVNVISNSKLNSQKQFQEKSPNNLARSTALSIESVKLDQQNTQIKNRVSTPMHLNAISPEVSLNTGIKAVDSFLDSKRLPQSTLNNCFKNSLSSTDSDSDIEFELSEARKKVAPISRPLVTKTRGIPSQFYTGVRSQLTIASLNGQNTEGNNTQHLSTSCQYRNSIHNSSVSMLSSNTEQRANLFSSTLEPITPNKTPEPKYTTTQNIDRENGMKRYQEQSTNTLENFYCQLNQMLNITPKQSIVPPSRTPNHLNGQQELRYLNSDELTHPSSQAGRFSLQEASSRQIQRLNSKEFPPLQESRSPNSGHSSEWVEVKGKRSYKNKIETSPKHSEIEQAKTSTKFYKRFEKLCQMGFPKDKVLSALAQSNNSLQRAIEILIASSDAV